MPAKTHKLTPGMARVSAAMRARGGDMANQLAELIVQRWEEETREKATLES